MKASYKQFKAILVFKVKKLDPAFVTPKLDKFLLFDNFLDLTNFLLFDFSNLNNFWPFNFFEILANFILLSLPLLNLTNLSLSFFISGSDMSGDLFVFNIEVSRA